MRVLVLTQHFAPEVTAGRFRVEAFAEALLARGHAVDVICPVPSHPHGIVPPEYRGPAVRRRRRGRLSVSYVPVLTSPAKSTATRLAYYASYAAAATVMGAVARRPDVVLASSPPLSVGAAGAALAARHRRAWVFDVRDLWPESAVTLGELSPGPALRGAEWLERRLYRGAKLILTPNRAFATHIASRLDDPGKVHEVPNGTTTEWLDMGESDVDRRELGLPDDRFLWAYAGNLGLAHAVDEAIDAARILGPEFLLVIAGTGPRATALRERARGLPAGTVEFRGLVEPMTAARLLRTADAVLVAERQRKTVSAKLYDCCAIGRPVVTVAEGELARVVSDGALGLVVPPGDPAALADAVRGLRDDPNAARPLTQAARAFAEESLREVQAERAAELLESVTGPR